MTDWSGFEIALLNRLGQFFIVTRFKDPLRGSTVTVFKYEQKSGHFVGHWDIRTDMGHTDGHIRTKGHFVLCHSGGPSSQTGL